MKKREEIRAELESTSKPDLIVAEILLDIRDLLDDIGDLLTKKK